jgi:DNA-binding MarR family transcriptional regulator
MSIPQNELTLDEYKILKEHGVELLHDLPKKWGKFRKMDKNYEGGLTEKTGIPQSTMVPILDALESWKAIEREKYRRGSRRYLISTPLGVELDNRLLESKDKDDDTLKRELERIIFGPLTREVTRSGILEVLDHLKKAEEADDDNAFEDSIDNLLVLIYNAEKENDDSWALMTELREMLVGLANNKNGKPWLSRSLGILADMISKTRNSHVWVPANENNYMKLVEALGSLLDREDDVSIAAIHVLKEIRNGDDKIPDSVFNQILKGVWITINDNNTGSFSITSAALDALDEPMTKYLSDEQKIFIRKQLTGIEISEHDKTLKRPSLSKEIPWNKVKVERLKHIVGLKR